MAASKHEESIPALFNTLILLAVIGLMVYASFFSEDAGILRFRPFALAMLALLLVALHHFRRLTIQVDARGLVVGYGMIRQCIPRKHIQKVSVDTFRAGTPGIGLHSEGGRWRLMYNVVGYRRVLVTVTNHWYSQFAFSTRDPDALVSLMEEGPKKQSGRKKKK